MYIRIPFMLKKTALHNQNPVFHSDANIIDKLNSLGCKLPDALDLSGNRAEFYETVEVQSGTRVKTGSLLHFRDLATKNAKKVFDPSSVKELQKYGIYFGTLPNYQANFYVARTSDECLTFYISQRDVVALHNCTQNIVKRLITLEIFDEERTAAQQATVFSAQAQTSVGKGSVKIKSWKNCFAQNKAEVIASLISFVGLLVSVSLSFLPTTLGDVDMTRTVNLATELWKVFLGATVIEIVTLVAKYRSMDNAYFDFQQS
jgi:hypothetical protein